MNKKEQYIEQLDFYIENFGLDDLMINLSISINFKREVKTMHFSDMEELIEYRDYIEEEFTNKLISLDEDGNSKVIHDYEFV